MSTMKLLRSWRFASAKRPISARGLSSRRSGGLRSLTSPHPLHLRVVSCLWRPEQVHRYATYTESTDFVSLHSRSSIHIVIERLITMLGTIHFASFAYPPAPANPCIPRLLDPPRSELY
ncbi:hypothetical protein BS50DRAFT_79239 [Corynespora cassiicola Philippines]|uniref:Uncharacterized protein n=1 Tax=Corynespora cassiicola Philippines TaxID=1448308 RepID=A0A2T2NI04_CORCC|nr:hypothetical protein BS50DRAFT_79239 [Corynespora cassiicola Philippines]